MSDWYVDKGLGTLIRQVKDKHPGLIVGTIAGTQHHQQNPDSDHEPEEDGSVDAGDFMLGKSFTHAIADAFAETLRRFKDRRIQYVIWNHRIFYSRVKNGVPAWEWQDYHGSDPHTGHVHVSVNDLHENDASEWQLSAVKVPTVKFTVTMPLLKEGANDADLDGYDLVARIQKQVGFTGKDVDGIWGKGTTKKLGYSAMDENRWRALFGLSR